MLTSHAFAQNIPTIVPYVNDFAGVLSQEDIDMINYLAGQIEKNSTVQVAVLTVRTTQPLTIEEYTLQVFRENGIGRRDNNNGLLIVVAVDDRTWRLEVGYGLEGTINDAKAGDIGRTYLVPNFRNGEYGLGLFSAVDSVSTIIREGNDPYLISQQDDFANLNSDNFIFIIIVVIFVFGVGVPIFAAAFSNLSRCPKCGKFTRGKVGYRSNFTEEVAFVCKNGHRWKKKRPRRFFFFVGPLGGWSSRGGGWKSGGGGGGFGGGSSGGGGAGGKF